MKNILSFLILSLYIILLASLWLNSKHPSFNNIPVIYIVGFIVAVIHVLVRKNKSIGSVTGMLNVLLFLICFVYLVGVYGLLKSIFSKG